MKVRVLWVLRKMGVCGSDELHPVVTTPGKGAASAQLLFRTVLC